MNNHKPEFYINDNNNKNNNYNNNFFNQNYNNCYYDNNNNNNNLNLDIISKILFILFCFFMVFLIYDFVIIYKNVKKDNNIERNRCMEEYKANKCDIMNVDDGPIVNEFCMEKLKCISEHTVYFHIVLIKYIKSFFYNAFKGNSIINVSLFSIVIIFIVKILF